MQTRRKGGKREELTLLGNEFLSIMRADQGPDPLTLLSFGPLVRINQNACQY